MRFVVRRWACLVVGLFSVFFSPDVLAAAPAQVWTQQYNGPGDANDWANAVALDQNGDVVVTGVSHQGTNIHDADFYTAKYRGTNGVLIWEKRYNGPANRSDAASSLAIDSLGNVIVTGSSANFTNDDIYTIKYSGTDGTILWEVRYNGPGNSSDDWGRAVTVDRNDNIVVAGHAGGLSSYPQSFIAKFSGTDGRLIWESHGQPPFWSAIRSMVLDKSGDLVVAGFSYNSTNADFFTAKYSVSDGALLWSKTYNGTAGMDDFATTVAVDLNGDVVATGYSGVSTTNSSVDFYTAKYSGTNGNLLWERKPRASTNAFGIPRAIVVDIYNCIIVVGTYVARYSPNGELYWERHDVSGQAAVGDPSGNTLVAGGGLLMQLAKYSPAGSLIWNRQIGDVTNGVMGWFSTIALGKTGQVVAAGQLGTNFCSGCGYDLVAAGYADNPVTITTHGADLNENTASLRGSAWTFVVAPGPDATIFYTLDGSDPRISGSLYSGPVLLTESATVRAVAYGPGLVEIAEADPVRVIILPQITYSTPGGGSVSIDPPNGAYHTDGTVQVTATPGPGWTFLQWLGSAEGTNPSVSIPMTSDKCVEAIFGTTLRTSVIGNGSIVRNSIGTLFPATHELKLTAVPNPGNYFAQWGGGLPGMGADNPGIYRFFKTNANVTALFATLPPGQYSLTVIENGNGSVHRSETRSFYPAFQSVTLTAVPEPGQEFLGWSGNATGKLNPISVLLITNRVITAKFTRRPTVSIGDCRWKLLDVSKDGVRLRINGDIGSTYGVQLTTNLVEWELVASLTNRFGTVQFTDSFSSNAIPRFYRAEELVPPQ